MSSTIIVSGLDPSTTQENLDQFFSFCGKINSITREEKSARITFENEAAAKTSLMLDGGTLDGAIIQVHPAVGSSEAESSSPPPAKPNSTSHTQQGPDSPEIEEIKQEDKPRSAICAEYLAHGYVIGDQAISKAIALDQKHGISSKFMSYFQKIQEKATKSSASNVPGSPDAPKQSRLGNLRNLSSQQYEKALKSPSGNKVLKFYTDTSKHIYDVHSEAKRIAEQKLGHAIFCPPALAGGGPATKTATT